MKKNVNPVAIGMFVLASAVISVVAVVVFGAAKFFAKTETFISFFSESVNGLDVGAPLKYKGVKIGKVEKIMMAPSKTIRQSKVAVIYSIDVDLLRRRTGKTVVDFNTWINQQITDGLRAKLNYQSVVTGMLYIELDFLAQAGESYKLYYRGKRNMIEIPSSESGLAELVKAFSKTIENVSQIDFKAIGENTNNLLANLNTIVANPETQSAPQKISQLLDTSNVLVKNVNDIVVSDDVKNAPKNLNKLMTDASQFMGTSQAEFLALSKAGQSTFANIDSVLKNVDTIVAPQSPLRYELAVLIRTLNESLNSISNLTDYIERNPSSLLTGKKKAKEASNEK